MPRPLPELPVGQITRLALNDHPYFFEDDVQHFVLWKLGAETVSDDEVREAMASLSEECGARGDSPHDLRVLRWTSFQNTPALMSIPEVQHAHVIVQWGGVAARLS